MAKLISRVDDDGSMHYGMGLRGSLCGVEDPKRRETPDRRHVTCRACLRELNKRPS